MLSIEKIEMLAGSRLRSPMIEKGINDALFDLNNMLAFEEDSTAQIMYRIGQIRAEKVKNRNAHTAGRINAYRTR